MYSQQQPDMSRLFAGLFPQYAYALCPNTPPPCGKQNIRGKKATSLGIVVPALQIVPARLLIVDIPTVAERVLCAQGARERAGAGKLLAPAIVSIFYYGVVAAVNQADDVALPIADIVVIGAVVVHGDHVAVCVVAEQELVAARHLRD